MPRTPYLRGRGGLAVAAGALLLALPASVQAASGQPASSGRAVARWGVSAHVARHATAARLAKEAPAAPAAAGPVTRNAFVYSYDTAAGGGLYLVQYNKDGVLLPPEAIIYPQPTLAFEDPSVSPDGTKVAYGEIDVTTGLEQVKYRTIGSSVETAVALSANSQCAPDWRDDTHILFTEDCDPAGSPALVLVDISTGTPSTLIDAAAMGRYHYDSTGAADRLAYVSVSGSDTFLATANADGTGQQPTTVPGIYPSLSPDGLSIVYEYGKTTGSNDGVATVRPDGTEVRLLPATASASVDAVRPSWSDSGTEIYYSAARWDLSADQPAGDYDVNSVDPSGLFVADITQTDTADEYSARFFGHIDPRVHGSQSYFTPVTPTRILDTRPAPYSVGSCGGIPAGSPLSSGGRCRLLVANGATVPTDANAVVLNLTGVSPTAATYLSVYPTTATNTPPLVSNLNLTPGQIAAVQVQVRLGTGTQSVGGSQVTIFNRAGTTHAVVDVVGYFRTSIAPTTGTYHPVQPKRIVDTRGGSQHVGSCATLGTNGTCQVDVTATSSPVPAGATAVVLNVTGITPTAATYLKLYPAGGSVPTVSNLNLGTGQIRANTATVKLGTGSSFVLANRFGTINVAVDVAGWYDADGSGSSYYPTPTPIRILDTRTAIKTAYGSTAPVGGNVAIDALASGYITTHAGLGYLPARPDGIVFNLTGVTPTANTYLSAYPSDLTSPPTVSNVNLPAGSIVPNLAIVTVPTTTGWLKVYNRAGNTHVLMDLFGYYN
ncbi:MAG: TolB family protein [Mycobacteriales bacterium]